MIEKKDLVVGSYYVGECRNAYVAKWDGDLFWYLRTKFGDTFAESIHHPEDDDGYDLFVPIREVDMLTKAEQELAAVSLEKYT
jgi:hypothetical protein